VVKRSLLFLFFVLSFSLLLSCTKKDVEKGKIRLAYIQNDLHHLPAFVALEKGYYRDEGLDVEVAGIFKAGPEEMSAFASHGLDTGYVGEAPVITARANKVASVTMIAQANKGGSALVVAKNSRITKIGDLRGKVVAIPGHATIQDVLLRMALKSGGIKPSELTIMVLKPPEMVSALGSHGVDAFMAWEPYPSKAVRDGMGRIILDSQSIWKDHPCCALIVDSGMAGNPARVKALIRAHLKAVKFIGENRSESDRIGVKYTGMDEATVHAALTRIKFDPFLSRTDNKVFVEFLRELGYITIDNIDTFIDGLMDQRYIFEAARNEKVTR